MKTTYRIAPGRFIRLDSYIRPRPHLGAFLASFLLSLAAALAISAAQR
jgi:hypothetical protein